MNEQGSVTIDREQPANRHWFRGKFYRKEGSKEVLDLKKFSYVSFAVFAVLVILSLFRDIPQQQSDTKPDISEPSQSSSNYQFPEIDLDQTTSNHSSVASSVKKALPESSGPQLIARPRVEIPPATMVRATLIEASSDGPVRARISQSLHFRGETAIDQGDILVGSGTSSEDRLQVRFEQLVHKDGNVRSVQAQAIDPDDRLAGVKGTDLGGTALKVGGSVGLTFLGAMTETLQDKEASAGVAYTKPNLKNAFLNGVSRTALEQSQQQLSELKDSIPKIKIEATKDILVIFE